MKDQAEKLRQLTRNSRIFKSPVIKHSKSRVITVTSGKGGVGKTNITVNLALALAALGQKILIIDADLGTANVDVLFGCSTRYNIFNLLEGINIEDIIYEGPKGIKFMSGGSGIYNLANLTESQLQYILSEVIKFDDWADIVLIDTGAGLSKNVLKFVTAADEVIIVTTPEPTAITDAYAIMKAYTSNNGIAPLHLIVNRVTETNEGQIVVDKLVKVALRFLGLSIGSLGFIYEDRSVVKAVKAQSPLLISHPDSISAQCIEHIANRLLYGGNVSDPKGIKTFLARFLGKIW